MARQDGLPAQLRVDAGARLRVGVVESGLGGVREAGWSGWDGRGGWEVWVGWERGLEKDWRKIDTKNKVRIACE